MLFPWRKFDLAVTRAAETAPRNLPATWHYLAWLLPMLSSHWTAGAVAAPWVQVPRSHLRHRRLVRVLQGPFSATCRKIFFSPISNIIQVLGSVAKVPRIICFNTLLPNDLRCPGAKWRSCTPGAGWIAVVVSLRTAVVYSWESCHNYSTVAVRVYLYFSEFAQLHVSYV